MFTLLFVVPAASSIVMLWSSWREGPFRRPPLLAIWCAVALYFQYRAPTFSALWVVALIAQVVLALYMAIRLKIHP